LMLNFSLHHMSTLSDITHSLVSSLFFILHYI
jgi:hypothetical protein